jgi:hypothetical protein
LPHHSYTGTWVDLRPDETEVLKMAPLLRLAAVDTASMPDLASALASWSAEPLPTWSKMQSPIGAVVEAAIAERVLSACADALALLPTANALAATAAGPKPPDPGSWESEAPPETTAERRAKMAARVKLGERHALEVCVAVWQRAAAAAAEMSGGQEARPSSSAR